MRKDLCMIPPAFAHWIELLSYNRSVCEERMLRQPETKERLSALKPFVTSQHAQQ